MDPNLIFEAGSGKNMFIPSSTPQTDWTTILYRIKQKVDPTIKELDKKIAQLSDEEIQKISQKDPTILLKTYPFKNLRI